VETSRAAKEKQTYEYTEPYTASSASPTLPVVALTPVTVKSNDSVKTLSTGTTKAEPLFGRDPIV